MIHRAGVILYRESSDEFLLVQSKYSLKWGFPKGMCEKHETIIDCAMRELKEETGCILDKTDRLITTIIIRDCEYFVVHTDRDICINKSECDVTEINDIQWTKRNDIQFISKNSGLTRYYKEFIQPIQPTQHSHLKRHPPVIDSDGFTVVSYK